MKIKRFIFLLLLFPLIMTLASCNNDLIVIGILQYVEHDALSEARRGFIDGLEEAGYVDGKNIKIKILNPQADTDMLTLTSSEIVRKSDLILAIATPAAIAVVNQAKEQNKNTPILFTAVTDPVDAKLIESNEKPGGNVTGTNDLNPIKEQIALVKELLPNAKKLGILYTSSEPNSQIQAGLAEAEALKLGLSVVVKTIDRVIDLQLVANQLANEVDIIYVPTDNLISSSMGVLPNILIDKKIPVIAGEAYMVRNGGSITIGVDYYRLGKETAAMAVKILKDGISPKDIPSVGLSNYSLIINKKIFDQMEITVPQELLDKADEILR